jgi:hypothetical protein
MGIIDNSFKKLTQRRQLNVPGSLDSAPLLKKRSKNEPKTTLNYHHCSYT